MTTDVLKGIRVNQALNQLIAENKVCTFFYQELLTLPEHMRSPRFLVVFVLRDL